MKSLERFSGPARVVVDHVHPALGNGEFPVKRPQGEPLGIVAHVIADGHDHLDVVLASRPQGSKRWAEVSLQDVGNDEFAGSITPENIGIYEYRIIGWADPFLNWHIEFVKKSDNGDSVIGV